MSESRVCPRFSHPLSKSSPEIDRDERDEIGRRGSSTKSKFRVLVIEFLMIFRQRSPRLLNTRIFNNHLHSQSPWCKSSSLDPLQDQEINYTDNTISCTWNLSDIRLPLKYVTMATEETQPVRIFSIQKFIFSAKRNSPTTGYQDDDKHPQIFSSSPNATCCYAYYWSE